MTVAVPPEQARIAGQVRETLLYLARQLRSTIPPPELTASMLADCARQLAALIPPSEGGATQPIVKEGDVTRSAGDVNATQATVAEYLMDNYRTKDGDPLTARAARLTIDKHRGYLESGERMLSHAAYVGDQIANDAELAWIEQDEIDEPDSDVSTGSSRGMQMTLHLTVTASVDLGDPFARQEIFRALTDAVKRQQWHVETKHGTVSVTVGLVTGSS